jgi:hypothetical protein
VGSCRARSVGHLVVTAADAHETGLVLADEALSLVIHNPSYVSLLLRWDADPVDPSDPRGGYAIALPGVSLCSLPIPDGAEFVSIGIAIPAVASGYEAVIDMTGADAITIWATPTNQGTFIGPLNSAPMPIRSTGS